MRKNLQQIFYQGRVWLPGLILTIMFLGFNLSWINGQTAYTVTYANHPVSPDGPSQFATISGNPTNTTFSQWNRSGLGNGTGSGHYNSNNWSTGSFNNGIITTSSIYYTVTNNTALAMTITSMVLRLQKSGTGPTQTQIFYRASDSDPYAAFSGTIINPPTSAADVNYGSGTISILPGNTATIRLVGWAAGGTAGTLRIVQGTINGQYNVPGGAFTIETAQTQFTSHCQGTSRTISIGYTSTGTFIGNFLVQISNASGVFPSNTSTRIIGSGTSSPLSAVIPDTLPAGTGYRVRVINSNPSVFGNDNGSNIVITPSVRPEVFIDASSTTVCEGGAILFGATTTNEGTNPTYTWYNGNMIVQTGPDSLYFSSTLEDGDTIKCELTSSQTCAVPNKDTSNIIIVNVEPYPEAGASATPNPICEGNTLQLNATGTGTYTWSGPNGFSSSGQTPSIPSVSDDESGIYIVTVTGIGGNSCSSTASVAVTVNPLPTPTPGATPNPVCTGNTLELSVPEIGTYAWTGPNGFSSSLQNPTIPNITSLFAGDYTVTVTSNGCSGTAVIAVTVNAGTETTATATPNPICTGNTLQLGTTAGSSYSWTGPNGFTSTIQNPSFLVTQTGQAGTYFVTVTSASGCTEFASVAVTVNQTPTTTITATPNPICEGSTLTLKATGGGTYAWTGPNTFTSTLDSISITGVTALNSGLYNVTVSAANGCSVASSVNVTVNTKPTVTATATPNPVCTGSMLALGASGGDQFSWTGPNSFTSTEQNPQFLINNTSQSGTYTVTVISLTGCSGVSSVNVTVNAAPTATASATPNPGCAGSTIQLSSSGGNTYAWSGPNGFTSTLQNPTLPNAQVNQSGNYTVTVTSSAGCSAVTSVYVLINPVPTTKINPSINPVCNGESVILYGIGAATYLWSTGANTPNITVTPTINTTYTVTGTIGNCTSTASIVITVSPVTPITINPASLSICVNDTITLSANGGVKYTWSTGETGSSIKVSPRENTTYTVTGTNANGCTGKATSIITVKDFEVSLTASKASICEGETITLQANGGTSYTWVLGSNSTGSTINVKPTTSTTYRVRITGANGCVKYLEVYIEVYPKPIVFINDPKSVSTPPVCPGTEIDLRAGGAYSYWWEPIALPGKIITVSPNATTRYTVTGSNIWGCTSTASINIPVFNPTSARIEPSTGKDPICKGEEITLTAVGLTKPTWWPGKQTTNSITLIPKDIVYAEVTGFDANGCQVTLVFDARTISCKAPGLKNNGGRSVISSDISVSVSPVPMKDNARFTFNEALTSDITLKLISIDGKVVRSERIAEGATNYNLDRNNLPSGMYFYHLISSNGSVLNTGKLSIME